HILPTAHARPRSAPGVDPSPLSFSTDQQTDGPPGRGFQTRLYLFVLVTYQLLFRLADLNPRSPGSDVSGTSRVPAGLPARAFQILQTGGKLQVQAPIAFQFPVASVPALPYSIE